MDALLLFRLALTLPPLHPAVVVLVARQAGRCRSVRSVGTWEGTGNDDSTYTTYRWRRLRLDSLSLAPAAHACGL